MDLHIIYSKTAKGSRAVMPWLGGLSSQMKRVLSKVNGKLSADDILLQSEKLTKKELQQILLKLENDGYIQRMANQVAEPDWLNSVSTYSMGAVNNYHIEVEEVDADALNFVHSRFKPKPAAKIKEATVQKQHQEAEVHAKAETEGKAKVEIAAKEKREAKRKAQAGAAEKARLGAIEQAKRIAEAEAKARQEIERIEREKAEADAKAKAKAVEEAEAEAERKSAAEELVKKAKQEAEEQARLEAKRIAEAAERDRLEAARNEREKAEAAEKARLEAEEQAKRVVEAEVKVRLEAEHIASEKAEAEAKTKAKAEEKARQKAQAESKAQARAAEKAKLEAEEQVKQTVERITKAVAQAKAKAAEEAKAEAERKSAAEELVKKAKQEAEEQARQEAERMAEAAERDRLEAERNEREKAEAADKAKAEANARLIAETKSKAAEEARLKAEVAEQARLEKEHIAREEAEKQARTEAERKARVEVEKKAQSATEKAAHEEAERFARQEKEAKAKLKAEEKAHAKKTRHPIMPSKWVSKSIKALLILTPIMAVLIVGLLHVVNLSMLIKPIEKLASDSIGEPVMVKEVHASLFPQPRLKLTDVTVGSGVDIKVSTVYMSPDVSTLFGEVKVLKLLEVGPLTLNPIDLGRQVQWVNATAKTGKLKIEQIALKQVSFTVPGFELAPFNGKVTRTPSGEFSNVELVSADRNLTLLLTPQNSSCAFTLTASIWQPPLIEQLELDEVTATGVVSQKQVSFTQIEAKAYGGTIKAQATVDWTERLSASGNFELTEITLQRALSAFGNSASVSGTLNASATFASSADQASELVEAAEVNANFEAAGGKVNGVALTYALLNSSGSPPAEADFTRFDTLTGNLQFRDGQYKYKQLALKTSQFYARGNLDIGPDQIVSGKVRAELTSKLFRRQASFNISGEVAHVKLQ